MKLFYFPIPILFLFLIGCSSTYRVTDYLSKEKFQEDVNSSIKNQNFNVVTIDSSFNCIKGSKIKDDSLYTIAKIKGEEVSLKDIEHIKYFGKTYEEPSASIWLKNGKELRVENVNILSNSFLEFTNFTDEHIPLMDIKQISYINHWKGVLPGGYAGLFIGGCVGSLTGAYILDLKAGGNHPERDYMTGAAIGAFYGIIAGAIVGYIIGWDNIYQFNP